jgi:hypothetical protein
MLKEASPRIRVLQHEDMRDLTDFWRSKTICELKHPFQCSQLPIVPNAGLEVAALIFATGGSVPPFVRFPAGSA